MSYVEQLKTMIEEQGGSSAGVRTVSDAIRKLEETLKSKGGKRPEYHGEQKSDLTD